jgi:hypothetical protein
MTIADWLMSVRPAFDPEPQRVILKKATLAYTDDPGLTDSLVPDNPVRVTDSVHDAQLASGTLMQGLPVAVKTGINHTEYVETLLQAMAAVVQKDMQQGGMATPQEITGLQTMAAHIAQHLQILAQDPTEKARVKQYGDALGKLMNQVKAFAQRLQEAMQKQAQANGNGGVDGETKAKIAAEMMKAQVKAKNQRESHAQRTAQRQLQWEMEQQRREKEHQQDMTEKRQEATLDLAKNRLKAIQE